MDKILGVDKTPKGTSAETKPFTNFAIFHDNIISRLKSLSQIQTDVQKRVKEAETRLTERTNELRKQLDHRWKQVDRFESRVQSLSDAKQGWRRKYNAKEGELESLKSQNIELGSQISALKRAPRGTNDTEIRAANARAAEADRRAAAAESRRNQDQDRISDLLERELKWEARVREYERMLKEAREALKREKQGGKENVAQHERQMAEQIAKMEKRFGVLRDMKDMMDDAAKPTRGKD
ncbi:uncharacterized protein EI90DRAFT_671985 [Cantharellus anzutake]|uniref:uncharacterized protein n=1 Tax=Cantharellus anzutake TaxID=1750568 RepID=UPI0019052BB9|nr:uncharacterized protein EI90DRAFT_671985 [Cantharellus anzutake]KAF8332590.1 hypothetical protein EI90DRAFT_671985 [Cantharellus anzutake]